MLFVSYGHTTTVPSELVLATMPPSGLNAIELSGDRCAFEGGPNGLSVSASQIVTAPVESPVAKTPAAGDDAALRREVPYPSGRVVANRSEELAVAPERARAHGGGVAERLLRRAAV